MACVCMQLEKTLRVARSAAEMIEQGALSGTQAPAIRRIRLARAYALGACDELESALEEHRREARCEESKDAWVPRLSGNVGSTPRPRATAEVFAEP